MILVARVLILLALAVPAAAQPAAGRQGPDSESPANPDRPVTAIVKDIAHDFGALFSTDSAEVLLLGAVGAATGHTFEKSLNHRLSGRGWVDEAFDPGRIAGYGLVQGGIAGAVYFWGRADRAPKVVHIGVDLLRAQIVTAGLTYSLKVAAGRDRPDGSGGYSFPSGHSAVTFATATVLQRHFGWKGAAAYSVATYVAVSRLHENRHYLSDVVFGAAIGTIAGRTVTRHGRELFTLQAVPVPGGAMVALIR